MGWDSIIPALPPIALAGLLLSAGIEDARGRTIAHWKNAAVALLAPLWWWTLGYSVWPDAVLQIALAAVVFGLFWAAFELGMMGGGDVKLIAALALWFPFPAFAELLVVMSLGGGLVTLVMLIDGRWRAWRTGERAEIQVPYGVAIAAAGLIALREPILNQVA